MLLLELMNEKHMTCAELSRRSGVPESTLRDILNGKAQIDHCEAGTLLAIADVLETTVDEIVVTYWEEALLHHDREVPLEELHDDSSMLTFYMIVDATKLALTAYSDLEFVCEICEEHWIERFHAEGAYRIAFFLLGFIRLFFDITPDGGSLDLVYHIVIEDSEAGEIDYHLDIRAAEQPQ